MHSIYPWQQQEWQYLLKRKNCGQLPHAILINGREGIGKNNLARCLAELLLCQKDTEQACGACTSCHLLQVGNHPDLIMIQPEEENKAIKVEQIREVIAELNHTAQQGGYKVVIVEHAELLNIAASNSLLKTLEEPATNVVIILVTHHPAALTATIRSRCQTVNIKTPTYDQVQDWLKQKILDADLKLVFALTENAPLKALELAKKENWQKRLEFLQQLYSLQNAETNIVQVAEHCLDWELKSLLLIFMYLVSDLIKIKFKAREAIINQDQNKELTQLAAKTSIRNLFAYLTKLLELHKHMIKNININQQLATENLLINWVWLFTK